MVLIRAAIYARVSTAIQAANDKVSIPIQIHKCRELITANGWKLVEIYSDPGYSSNTLNRPALQKLFGELFTFDVLVCYDPDRISRDNQLVEATIFTELDNHRVQVTSVTQPIQIVTPSDYDPRENDTVFIQRRISGLAGGLDNRRRRRRLRDGRIAKMRKGLMCSPRPYGYAIKWCQHKNADGKIQLERSTILHPTESRVVQRIFREYIDGRSSLAIAQSLNLEKIPTRRNSLWHASTVRTIVRSPVYYGMMRLNYMQTRNGKRLRVPCKDWQLLEGRHPPIISKETYVKAQAVLNDKKKRYRAIASPKLLSGIARCGLCGASMWVEGSKHAAYVCGRFRTTGMCMRNGYGRLELERAVLDDIKKLIVNPERIHRIKEEKRTSDHKDAEIQIVELETQSGRIRTRKTRLIELYEVAAISKEEFIARREVLEAQEKTISKDLQNKKEMVNATLLTSMTMEDITSAVNTFFKSLEQRDISTTKKHLRRLIDRIEVREGTYSVKFRFS